MKKNLFRLVVGAVAIGGLLNLSFAALSGAISNGGSAVQPESQPEVYIRAINPGYTVDGISNVGEMIEIGRVGESDELISLAGLTVDYTNSSGKTATLVEFPEHSFLAGETILLRLASSPGSELANVNYTKTLAMKAGPLTLRRGEEIIDEVCWSGKEDCFKAFSSKEPMILWRESFEAEMKMVEKYEPEFKAENYRVDEPEEEPDDGYGEDAIAAQCRNLQFSEILSYYETLQSEQFIELYNAGSEQILLNGCKIKYKNKYYDLAGIVSAEKYFVRELNDFKMTKNPTTSNVLEIIDVDGEVVDRLEYPNGQRKGTSWAMVGYGGDGTELWHVTYAPTAGEPNNYQEYKTCEVGKVINPETGNCVKVTSVEEKTCEAGYYLNPLTGRCRKIQVTEAKTCKEGYELNPETNRCRKIKENTGASYSIEPEEYEEESSFVALYVVLGVIGVGALYVLYEFRREICRFFKRIFRRSR
ncbi:MAG: hypothetical protein Q4B34_01215 [Candidatus Saccharibacteria bacterium]|nr:hypothetical protein [Candidatus Saccharibacteria bacterium]